MKNIHQLHNQAVCRCRSAIAQDARRGDLWLHIATRLHRCRGSITAAAVATPAVVPVPASGGVV